MPIAPCNAATSNSCCAAEPSPPSTPCRSPVSPGPGRSRTPASSRPTSPAIRGCSAGRSIRGGAGSSWAKARACWRWRVSRARSRGASRRTRRFAGTGARPTRTTSRSRRGAGKVRRSRCVTLWPTAESNPGAWDTSTRTRRARTSGTPPRPKRWRASSARRSRMGRRGCRRRRARRGTCWAPRARSRRRSRCSRWRLGTSRRRSTWTIRARSACLTGRISCRGWRRGGCVCARR
mmetsp:Transcript_7506/g.29621  ORF Transcript_7506/g.29621 Transcript_7506/m.29621 type:complete len:235 (+) Transcript_7506:909-1613(+)